MRKIATLTLMLAIIGLSAYGIEPADTAQVVNDTSYDAYYYTGSSNLYLRLIPSKLFIKKSSESSQEWLVSLLREQIGNQFRIGWIGDDMCKVFVDDSSIDIDKVITKLLKEDDILVARRIYVPVDDYERYLNNGTPELETVEICPLNGIVCGIKGKYSEAAMDSISNAMGIAYEFNTFWIGFSINKTSDIFELIHELQNSGYFTFVSPDSYTMAVLHYTTIVNQVNEDIQDKVYYNLSGIRVDTPSGVTIVVTRYSDGSVRTEKRFY